jgi:hypothetical protein
VKESVVKEKTGSESLHLFSRELLARMYSKTTVRIRILYSFTVPSLTCNCAKVLLSQQNSGASPVQDLFKFLKAE